MKYDETIRGMIEDSTRVHVAQVNVARALARLPDNAARRKALRAVAILLDHPEIFGDRPNV